MKEIDKIRIRQWNQDNPYIQMKNLENAQPGCAGRPGRRL